MQTQLLEKCNELGKCMSKPFVDLMELNINTFNEWTRNRKGFNEMSQIRKPEDMLSIQAKLGTEIIQSIGDYMQKFSNICIESANQYGKLCNNLSNDMINKASKNVNIFKHTTNKVAKKVKTIHKKERK